MKRIFVISWEMAIFATLFTMVSVSGASGDPAVSDVRNAMKRAAAFMAGQCSSRGGYVSRYSADLSERWAEIPARDTQISVQPPGTTTVAESFLDAYNATGDTDYLAWAEKAADAIVYGQHPAGGWHYVIDFDPTGLPKWYDEFATHCWGWEEYYHYYGNCTFDDEATTAPAHILMDLYLTTLDPAFRTPLIKVLGFVLRAQFPNGAWPQRFPLRYDHVKNGHADYTSYYTLNDGVAVNNIHLLFEAWERLGDEAYRDAALRGMNFLLAAQLAAPQAGWADQYNYDIKPAWGRSYEPPAVCSIQTIGTIRALFRFYRMTGDRRFIEAVKPALDWLDNSYITDDPDAGYTHAYYYEIGTNRPLYTHRYGTRVEDESFTTDYVLDNLYPYGPPYTPNLKVLRREYERLVALSPVSARAEYAASKRPAARIVSADAVAAVIDNLDDSGAWITDFRVPSDYFGDVFNQDWRTVTGIEVNVFARNMRTLIDYCKQNAPEKQP